VPATRRSFLLTSLTTTRPLLGCSDRGEIRPDQQNNMVIPGHRFAIVGQSYGGYLARGVLARRTEWVDGMALLCPAIIADRPKRDLPKRAVIVKDDALLASLSTDDATAFGPNFVVQTQSTWRRFRDELLPAIRGGDQGFLEKLSQRYAISLDVDALAQPFSKPVLMLTGRQDSDVGYRDQWKILENYPRGTFAVLDRAGHGLAIEQSALFTSLVGEWVARVEEAWSSSPS
jgi:pimeloyl-ACP methyl ester carboxylesterase